MASLLSRGDSFDALLSANDHMAIGAIKAIKAHGLRIPQDIAVVGFDNLSISSMIEPALTTMRPPALQMAAWRPDLPAQRTGSRLRVKTSSMSNWSSASPPTRPAPASGN